ncbi:MAG: M28 family peptidase [Vicinamibacterales bacterium]
MLSVAAIAACGPAGDRFVTSNARVHVNMLAETIGSRPAGSEANRRAREYLVDQLQLAGMQVRVQDTDARRPDLGIAGRVSNIVAIRQGPTSDAIALVAHYDSVADGPGAGDNAFGTAVAVEAARVLAAAPMRHSLMVLLTDSEESGLLGAAGAMSDPAIRDRIAAYMNVEAVGSSGPALLFETGPGTRWLTSVWARHAPFPRGASFAAEIYKRTPNDTDFSILKRSGIPGLNFAIIGDSSAYHTDRDTAARLDDDSLTTAGENVIAIATALDGRDLRRRTMPDAIYFDVAGEWALSYGPVTALVIGVVAIVLGVLAWLRATIAAVRTTGVFRFIFTAAWVLIGAAAVIAAMVGAIWLLRATREVYHPWYGQMGRAAAFMVSAGIAAGWLLSRAGAMLPGRMHSERHPAAVWSVALPFWIAAAAAAMWFAPGAAHLATVPLLAAGVLFLAMPLHVGTAVRIGSIIVLAIAASIWLRNAIDLLFYANALLGRLAIVAPIWAFPAILAIAGLFIVPPFIAAVTAGSSRLARPSIFSTFCIIVLAITGLAAYFGDAYSDRHPLRRFARYVQDDGTRTAMWEIGGNEPGLDVDVAPGLQWRPDLGAEPRSVPVAPLPYPFRFIATATPSATPATMSASVSRVGEALEMTVIVRPHDPSAFVTLMLPPGVKPVRASLPGTISNANNRWRSTFVAPPPEGVMWRLVLTNADETRAGDTAVFVQSATGPEPWMPRATAAWSVRSLYVMPVGPLLAAPVPGIR